MLTVLTLAVLPMWIVPAPPAPQTPPPEERTAEVTPTATPPTAAPTPTTPERKVLRIAVRDFVVSDAEDERLARLVTDAMVGELRKLDRVSVTSMEEVRTLMNIEGERQLAGCVEGSCISEIVEALGVDAIVVGALGRVGDDRVFSAKLLDQREGRAIAEVNQTLTLARGEESLAMIGPAVERLLPTATLRPGTTRGVSPELALRLNPPPLSPWVVVVGGGATAVALAVGLVATGSNAVATQQANGLVDDARAAGGTVNGAALTAQTQTIESSFVALVVSYGAAAVLAAGTGVAALFTDWSGSGE